MQLLRFRVRTLLIGVGLLAILLVGGLECFRLKRLSDKYEYYAWAYSGNVRMRLADLARYKSILKKLKESPKPDRVEIERLGASIEREEASVAWNANLVQIYEHAASHPWETPPLVAEGFSGVENSPIPKRILTKPFPPEPYRPPGFLQTTIRAATSLTLPRPRHPIARTGDGESIHAMFDLPMRERES